MQITPGFYYHYKHDHSGSINNYAYEVLGVGSHTEKEESSRDRYVVVYRPLYESGFYMDGKMFAIRPYDMFVEEVEVNGVNVPRFRFILENEIIEELAEIKRAMYGELG
jgi:hypothetical protein